MDQNQTLSLNVTDEENKFSSNCDNFDLKLLQQDSQDLIEYISGLEKRANKRMQDLRV